MRALLTLFFPVENNPKGLFEFQAQPNETASKEATARHFKQSALEISKDGFGLSFSKSAWCCDPLRCVNLLGTGKVSCFSDDSFSLTIPLFSLDFLKSESANSSIPVILSSSTFYSFASVVYSFAMALRLRSSSICSVDPMH